MTTYADVMADIRAARPKRSKYGNQPTIVDGVRFASKKEAKRWGELQLLVKAGEIDRLERQPRYDLAVNGEKIAAYVGDFTYWLPWKGAVCERRVVEDVKGLQTPVFKLKAKLFRALYPHIELRLT